MAKLTVQTNDLHLDASGTLQEQLYQQLTHRIIAQQYLAGDRLPSSRQLAFELNISRNTVNAVYEQLKAEGFLTSQPGKGFFVNQEIGAEVNGLLKKSVADSSKTPVSNRQKGRTTNLLTNTEKTPPTHLDDMSSNIRDTSLPLTPGLPDLSAFPVKAWNRILHHQESRKQLMGYDEHQGYLPLQNMIAAYLRTSRGVKCSPEQIIVTHGAQQALALIAEVCLRTGDKVLTEDPGYRGARYALSRFGNELIPVPLKNQVLNVSALPSDSAVALLYCTPTHQYPMGGILDIAERVALLNWAIEHKVWIIEDDYDSEFHFNSKPFPAIQGIYEHAPVLYVGSFSKTLLPSLRIGYLVVPETMIDVFVWTKRITSGESPLLMQAVVAEFIESEQFSRHLRKMRQRYKEKWELFQELIASQINASLQPVAESAGMHLVLRGDVNDLLLSKRLFAAGLGSAALSSHFISQVKSTGLILGFASANKQQLVHCIELIKAFAE